MPRLLVLLLAGLLVSCGGGGGGSTTSPPGPGPGTSPTFPTAGMRVEDSDTAVTFTGAWTKSAQETQTAGEIITLPFRGTAAKYQPIVLTATDS